MQVPQTPPSQHLAECFLSGEEQENGWPRRTITLSWATARYPIQPAGWLKKLQTKQKHPAIINPVLDSIEAIVLDAMKHLDEPAYLGRLMDMNHCLLETLGVGHPQPQGWFLHTINRCIWCKDNRCRGGDVWSPLRQKYQGEDCRGH